MTYIDGIHIAVFSAGPATVVTTTITDLTEPVIGIGAALLVGFAASFLLIWLFTVAQQLEHARRREMERQVEAR